jgi:hypothetical protein
MDNVLAIFFSRIDNKYWCLNLTKLNIKNLKIYLDFLKNEIITKMEFNSYIDNETKKLN